MRIAVIGAGIAGLYAAWRLSRQHQVTVFEAGNYPGGHTNTVDVEWLGKQYAIDTGFIVFNDWTYPNFIAMLRELGVTWQPSNMSFSLRCERSGLEYNGTSLNSLFAQRRNILRPSFLRMIADILRFNRESRALLKATDDKLTLGEYLRSNGYSDVVHRTLHPAHGSRDLVRRGRCDAVVPGALFRRLFRAPRLSQHRQSPAVASGARWLARVRAQTDCVR